MVSLKIKKASSVCLYAQATQTIAICELFQLVLLEKLVEPNGFCSREKLALDRAHEPKFENRDYFGCCLKFAILPHGMFLEVLCHFRTMSRRKGAAAQHHSNCFTQMV